MTQEAYKQSLCALLDVQMLAFNEELTQQDKDQCEDAKDLFYLTDGPITALRDYARIYGFDKEPQV